MARKSNKALKKEKKKAERNRRVQNFIGHMLRNLDNVLDWNNDAVVKGRKGVSKFTKKCRRSRLRAGCRRIIRAGYDISHPDQLKPKHVKILVQLMKEEGLSNSTIAGALSAFRALGGWMGKPNLVGKTEEYASTPKALSVPTVTRIDKSWSGNNVDVLALVEEVNAINPKAAIVLELMFAFGLRIREAALLRPHIAAKAAYLDLYEGTKGKRPRTAPIESTYQREVLDRARQLISKKRGNLVEDDIKLDSWIRKCYRIYKKVGISRKHGIVPHGLRHEFLQLVYQSIALEVSPIKNPENLPDPLAHLLAMAEVAQRAGHNREDVPTYYVGSNHKLKIQAAMQTEQKLAA